MKNRNRVSASAFVDKKKHKLLEYSQESELMEIVAKFILVVMTEPECFDLLKLFKEGKVVESMRDTPSTLCLRKEKLSQRDC